MICDILASIIVILILAVFIITELTDDQRILSRRLRKLGRKQ